MAGRVKRVVVACFFRGSPFFASSPAGADKLKSPGNAATGSWENSGSSCTTS